MKAAKARLTELKGPVRGWGRTPHPGNQAMDGLFAGPAQSDERPERAALPQNHHPAPNQPLSLNSTFIIRGYLIEKIPAPSYPLLSRNMVTGPWFTRYISIMAPKRPVRTSSPFLQNSSAASS